MSASRHRAQGFTIVEMLVVLAIVGILAALASSSMVGLRRQAQASGEARLLVYRLQSARTLSVSQGWPQGYYVGAPGDANPVFGTIPWCPVVGCGFAYKATASTAPPTYTQGLGQEEYPFDPPAYIQTGVGTFAPVVQVTLTTPNTVGATPFTIGFDLNGLPSVNPPPVPLVWPLCLAVQNLQDATTLRWVIVFADGTTRIQQANETYCL